jgi:Tfp pilus assembly protein PilX
MTKNRGIALFIVLGMFFIIILLGNVAIGIISTQARITHHGVSRIQALYAAQAASNLAYERLRAGNWPVPAPNASQTYFLCRSAGASCDIVDPALPLSIANNGRIQINVLGVTAPAGACPHPSGQGACVKVNVNYVYVNP